MRARNIKPSFFSNEDLGSLTMAARLLFQGLWCVADCEGRLEDRPRRLKTTILPYDEVDVDALLNDLHRLGMIVRYQSPDGGRYIEVVNFKKHQNPHVNEKKKGSSIPAPDQSCTSTVPAPDPHSTDRADSLFLNPSSLNPESGIPLPDSGIPLPEPKTVSDETVCQQPPAPDDCPHEAIVAAYHEILPELPRVRVWGDGQKKTLKARWREEPGRRNLDWWRWYFREVSASDFLMGRTDRPWAGCNLLWLIGPKNMVKVLNGQYQNRGQPPQDAGRLHLSPKEQRSFDAANRWLERKRNERGNNEQT